MFQLNIRFPSDEDSLRHYLQQAVGKTVSLTVTDNSSSVLSLSGDRNTVKLRLHRMFLAAGPGVLDELADFIRKKREKTPLVRKFINDNAHTLKKKYPNRINHSPEGMYHNLAEIYDSINREYFSGGVSAGITWGVRRRGRAAARRTLGSYSGVSNTIRINPLLDSKRVPGYFIGLIVYHEMLHADIGIKNGVKRRLIHPPEFKRREKLFEHYDRAIAWEKKSL